MELHAHDATSCAVLTALYGGSNLTLAYRAAPGVELRASGGLVVTAPLAAARFIARSTQRGGDLLPASPNAHAEMDEWLESVCVLDVAALARAVDGAAATRTYLAGAALSLADVAVYAALASGAAPQPLGVHATRWRGLVEARLPLDDAKALGWPTASATAAASSTPASSAPQPAAPSPASEASAAPAAPGKARKPAGPGGAAAAAAAAIAGKAAAAAAVADRAAAAAAAGDGGASPAAGVRNIGGGGNTGGMPTLKGAVHGAVVTRFPPEPSGYMHIGHAKAALLNEYYARAYGGRLLIRFDDTNPSKEKVEFENNIIADLAALGIVGDAVSHTSDHFDAIIGYARRMIAEGKAFMDDTPKEAMQEERGKMLNSARRDTDAATNAARFDDMLAGGPEGSKWCLRARINMQDPNGTCRDPVIFRGNETPHHRTGTRYRAYPTYDFACPIVDSLEGVTHALRSSEYHDRDVQFAWMLRAMGLRNVVIQDFSRLNFSFTLLSKRKLAWFVEHGVVDGWGDARFPTVQGMLRRGLVVPALREFIMQLGASKRIVDMEWDKFWATNKKHVDPVAPRYTALLTAGAVPLRLVGGDGLPAAGTFDARTLPLHPKTAAVGSKTVYFGASLLLEAEDADALRVGEEVTLMKWGNVVVSAVHRAGGAGAAPDAPVVAVEATLHLAGDFKKTEKKLTWLPGAGGPAHTPLQLVELDYLITVPKLDEGADFEAAINPVTELRFSALGEPAMRDMRVGDIVQLERKGYYRCDRAAGPAGEPAVLLLVPDGRVKGLFNLAARKAEVEGKAAARAAAIAAAGGATA